MVSGSATLCGIDFSPPLLHPKQPSEAPRISCWGSAPARSGWCPIYFLWQRAFLSSVRLWTSSLATDRAHHAAWAVTVDGGGRVTVHGMSPEAGLAVAWHWDWLARVESFNTLDHGFGGIKRGKPKMKRKWYHAGVWWGLDGDEHCLLPFSLLSFLIQLFSLPFCFLYRGVQMLMVTAFTAPYPSTSLFFRVFTLVPPQTCIPGSQGCC